MKKRILALMLTGMCLTPSISLANSYYVGGSFGKSIPFDSKYSYDNGTGSVITSSGMSLDAAVVYGLALGLKQDDFRFELEYRHQQNDVKSFYNNAYPALSGDKVSISSFLVNAYLDINEDAKINPYIMTGIGLSSIDSSGPRHQNVFIPNSNNVPIPDMDAVSKTVFTWQIGLGAGIRASKHVVVDVGYRYLHPAAYKAVDPTFGNIKITAARSNLLLGVQYFF
jgi:opacity protein-like surface antigen